MSEQEKREFIITAHDDVFEKWLLETGKQELIRCKNCINCKDEDFDGCLCAIEEEWHKPDWFCADGRKRDEN